MFALCEITFVCMSMNIAWPKKSAIAGPIDAGNENKALLPGTSEGDAVLKHPTKAIKAPKISNVDFMYTFVKNVSTFLVCSMLSTVVSFAYLIVFLVGVTEETSKKLYSLTASIDDTLV